MFLCVVFRESPNHFGNDLLNLARQNRAKQFGGHKAVVRPVPIPNTAVKHSLADGSGCIASARVGCRQILYQKSRNSSLFRLFLFTNWKIVQPSFFFASSGNVTFVAPTS